MKTRGRTGLIGDGGRRLVGAGSEGGAKGRGRRGRTNQRAGSGRSRRATHSRFFGGRVASRTRGAHRTGGHPHRRLIVSSRSGSLSLAAASPKHAVLPQVSSESLFLSSSSSPSPSPSPSSSFLFCLAVERVWVGGRQRATGLSSGFAVVPVSYRPSNWLR